MALGGRRGGAASGSKKASSKHASSGQPSNEALAQAAAAARRKTKKPLIIPKDHPIDLLFFRKIFSQLREKAHKLGVLTVDDGQEEIPIALFQRVMARLCRVLAPEGAPVASFDAKEYDKNGNGSVGWWEFCSVWKDKQITLRMSTAERIFCTFDDAQSSRLSQMCSTTIIFTIVLSSCCFILATLPLFQEHPENEPWEEPQPKAGFQVVEVICVLIFTIEYLARLCTSWAYRSELINKASLLEIICDEDVISKKNGFHRFIKFLVAPANLVDLAAIAPFYISLIVSTGGNSLVVLRLIRLTRIVRAFRLGKYVEAVIIIVRAVKQSLRALYVLMLNLILGVVIFGSLIFFAEQGVWKVDSHTYQRTVGLEWVKLDPECIGMQCPGQYSEVTEESPFRSIPSAFWWALVTATTVGYGDDFPKTGAGKFVAAMCMMWSLVVLALPIGIIGNTFGRVWDEYDEEKRTTEETKLRDAAHVLDAMKFVNPSVWSESMLVEVFDDDGFIGPSSMGDFLGEAHIMLDLSPNKSVTKKHVVSLQENRKKAKRKVRGSVTVEYTWNPMAEFENGSTGQDSRPSLSPKSSNSYSLHGHLDVRVLSCENLLNLGWKLPGRGICDPYVRVTCYPRSPGADGLIKSEFLSTTPIMDSINPEWPSHKATVNYVWRRVDWDSGAASRKFSKNSKEATTGPDAKSSQAPLDAAQGAIVTDKSAATMTGQDNLVQCIKGQLSGLTGALLKVQQETEQLAARMDSLASLQPSLIDQPSIESATPQRSTSASVQATPSSQRRGGSRSGLMVGDTIVKPCGNSGADQPHFAQVLGASPSQSDAPRTQVLPVTAKELGDDDIQPDDLK